MAELSTNGTVRGFADAVNRVAYAGERVVITRRGKPMAVIVPLADLSQLERRTAPRRSR
jgi:prevent-host-death family protein